MKLWECTRLFWLEKETALGESKNPLISERKH